MLLVRKKPADHSSHVISKSLGTVQGVFFRKHTQQQATKLNLVGWVKNAASGTVQGHMEGRKEDISQMKTWLRTTGSPKSKITKAEFSQ